MSSTHLMSQSDPHSSYWQLTSRIPPSSFLLLFHFFPTLFLCLNTVNSLLVGVLIIILFAIYRCLIPFWALSFPIMYTILIYFLHLLSVIALWERWRIRRWSSPLAWIVAVVEYGRALLACLLACLFCFGFIFFPLTYILLPPNSSFPKSPQHHLSRHSSTTLMYNTITMLYHFIIFIWVDISFHRTLKSSNYNQMTQRKLKSVNIIHLITLLSCYWSRFITMANYEHLW